VSLTLNNAPAKDALMSLARLGGYGFVFVGDGAGGNGENASGTPVSMAFRNERFDRALNSVLLASGLQGKMDGRTLLVGTSVAAKTFGPQMSKVFRLNQVDVEGAAQYLASMGASMTHVKTIQITTGEAATAGATQISNAASQTTNQVTETETYGSATGPLVGLSGVTNSRLNTVTLVGDPGLINIAESYLRQLDLRNRQVAVNVQILSVSLTNDKTIDASFSARMGDKYVVSESGKAHMNFGRYRPGSRSGTGLIQEGGPVEPGTYAAGTAGVAEQQVFDPPFVEAQQVVVNAEGETELVPRLDQFGRPIYVPSTDPAAAPALKPVLDSKGRPIYVEGQDPSRFQQPQDSFYAYVESLITSSSAKTLAEPTLIVQEGEQAQVETGQSVITGVDATETANGSTQFQNTRENAGLTVDVSVQKIDDNGFVTLTLDPEISVPIPAGTQQGVAIFNIQARKLRSGRVRLRDGQSLILTGVINEQDRQQVQKWPILGDIPLIGQLFRQSASSRVKDELVIIVTPRILDDDQGGSFGYGYRAGTSASRQLVQSRP
jgi:type IV pilus assembly protein PilQ